MKRLSLSLLQKTILAVIVVSLPLIITFLYNYNKNTEYIKEDAIRDLANTELVYEGLIYQSLEKAENRVQDFSSDGYIRDGAQKILEGQKSSVETLSDYISRNKLILDKTINMISIMSLDGKVLTSTNISTIGNDFSSEEFFLKGKNGISVASSENGTSGLTEIVASAPLTNISTGMPIGVIANSMHISELNKVLEKVMTGGHDIEHGVLPPTEGKDDNIEVYLVNYNKRFITKPVFVRDELLNLRVDTLPVNKCIKSNEEFAGFYKNYRNVDVAGASVCLPEMKWVLLIEANANNILAHTKEIGSNISITAFIVAGIIGVLFIVFYEVVVKQIRKISAASERIADGIYNITIPIESEDEIGILSRSFNKMASEISRRTNELEESGKKLKEAQHIARLGSWDWDIVKDKLHWSDEIYNIFGVELDEFEDSRFLKFVHLDDREFVNSAVNDALYNKKPYSIDYRIVLKGGGEKFIHEQGVVALNSTGEPVRMVGTIQDITERKILEKSQLELQQRYEELINSLNAGVFKIDTDGKMIEVNKACVMMAEAASKEELLKHNVLDLLENKNKLKEIVDRLLKGESVVDEEIPFITIKGNEIWTSVSTVLKKGDKGNIYLEGIIEEITEKKKLEDQLRHSQKMESVGILAGGLAHDFNNILSAIMNYGNLLIMKKGGDETTKKFAEQIILASEKGASLTRGILAFSRKQVMNLQVADMNELVRKIEKILLRLIGEDIELKVNLTDKTLTVNIDEIQIDQVLMNLATNARDALQKGGAITISTNVIEINNEYIKEFGYGELGKYALISFSDNGVGMDEGTRKKIFEPFFTTKGVGKGTGLGLSMSYGIVKQHNGYINVFSEPNKGTEFKIYLPLSGQSVSIRKTVKVSTPIRGSETVLLAEDNSVVRETAKAILEEYGYKVIEAVDGEDAVKKFIENKDGIKLIISDMIMPKKSGKEAYEEIKKISPGMKVLFISGYAPDLLKAKALHEDGMNFILKPVVPDNLLRKVREVIDSKD
ncbi:MAG: PAS domain-containing protein [Nitrospinae bacterium]|nr:PAS domain-containing protein [Nitrospinota bacterium]